MTDKTEGFCFKDATQYAKRPPNYFQIPSHRYSFVHSYPVQTTHYIMHDDAFHQRLKELYRMLFELATGNLTFRIHKDASDDLGKLAEVLNTFAAQMHLAIKKSGYVIPYYTYQNLIHSVLLLDGDSKIAGFTDNVPVYFSKPSEELLGIQLEDLLSPESKALWKIIQSEISRDELAENTIQLQFLIDGKKMKSAFCTLCRLINSNEIILSIITTSLNEIAELNQNATAHPSDAKVIQDLYDYIMLNLEKPLPTIKELAQLFRTNEFKLKNGFRHFFNSGIHHFYNSERLKRAHLLIEQTAYPLKSVAYMSGFRDYVAFSKAFKKEFGYGPGTVARNPGESL